MKTPLALVVATAALLACASAGAQQAKLSFTPDGRPQVRVSYADLDIARPADAAVLSRRIHAAAEQVCGPRPESILDIVATREFKQCLGESLDSAFTQLRELAADLAVLSRRR